MFPRVLRSHRRIMSQITQSGPYNYPHFRVEHYFDGTRQPGIRAGDGVPSATLETLDGEVIKVEDCWTDAPAVIEFGSITCPIFQANVDPMNELAASYSSSVNFYLVYVREAHPGPRCGPHKSMDDKRSLALEIAPDLANRTILIDDLEGSVHTAFDAMPNSAHLVGTDGVVAYRSDWLHTDDLEAAFEELLNEGGDGADVTPQDVTDNFHSPNPSIMKGARRAFGRAGLGSAIDFARALPGLARHRLQH